MKIIFKCVTIRYIRPTLGNFPFSKHRHKAAQYIENDQTSNIYNMSGRVVSDIQTQASRRREFVYLIQHGRECCK